MSAFNHSLNPVKKQPEVFCHGVTFVSNIHNIKGVSMQSGLVFIPYSKSYFSPRITVKVRASNFLESEVSLIKA
jgi:hypothetical protein